MENNEVTLYTYRSNALLPLNEAVRNCKDILEGAIALLYSPDSCKFLWLKNGEFEYPSKQEKEHHRLDTVFEARVFSQDYELRWLNRNNGRGDAVLLSESNREIKNFSLLIPKRCEAIEQKYLLWGEPIINPENIQEGWQRLAEARIGKLNIPITENLIDKQQRVYLKSCEYISTVDHYGNVGVIEERLVQLEVKK